MGFAKCLVERITQRKKGQIIISLTIFFFQASQKIKISYSKKTFLETFIQLYNGFAPNIGGWVFKKSDTIAWVGMKNADIWVRGGWVGSKCQKHANVLYGWSLVKLVHMPALSCILY